jgi:hypothetical protein
MRFISLAISCQRSAVSGVNKIEICFLAVGYQRSAVSIFFS